MTRGADGLPVTDHAVLHYLQRVLGVDIDRVRRQIHADTAAALAHDARGLSVNGIVYRIKQGYVTTCFAGDPHAVRQQHAEATKKILRNSKRVPLLEGE